MKYAVLILGLFLATYANAQDHLKDFSLKRSLKQDGLHLQFMVLDADKRGVRNHEPGKFYHWTKAQQVRITQGGSSGQLLHGLFEAFYSNKQLAQKGSYCKGLKHGSWKYWYQDGTFQRTESWRHGVQLGKQQFFNESGELVRTEFIHGKRKKIVQPDSVIHYKSFNRKTILLLDSIGQKEVLEKFQNNELNGVQKTYANGKVASKVHYKKGVLVEKRAAEDGKEGTPDSKKEPGKIKELWDKYFKKEKSDKESSENKEQKEKTKKKEKNAE